MTLNHEANIGGMDCASCVAKIEHVVGALDGVANVSVDLTLARMRVELHEGSDHNVVDDAVRKLGYTVSTFDRAAPRTFEPEQPIWRDARLIAVVVGAVATVVGAATGAVGAYLVAIALGGAFVFRNAFTSLRHLHLDINVLMTIAVIGAVAIGEWLEGATVVVLFSFAEWLEGASMTRARRAIRDLMELAPPVARVLRGGVEVEVSPDDVAIGERLIVRPGEKIAVDGVVVVGRSEVDQASLTGESIPVERTVGDEVFAGTLNTIGTLEVTTTKFAHDTAIAHVVKAIEEARENRSESERFIERFARIYTPIVVVIAVLIAVIPPLLFGGAWSDWFYRALVMLVIACPCALVIATPITTVSALARAARDGVLIKGGRHLEQLGAVRSVVFDKTGTLTQGKLAVHEVVAASDYSEHDVLAAAALAEQKSEHAIGRAIVRASIERGEENVAHVGMRKIEAYPGEGIAAWIAVGDHDTDRGHHHDHDHHHHNDHGHHHDHDHTDHGHSHDDDTMILVGTIGLMERSGVDTASLLDRWRALQKRGSTVVGVARDRVFLGLIECRDVVRPEARAALDELRALGVDDLHICTGDHRDAALLIAEEVGVPPEHVQADLFPVDKVNALKSIKSKSAGAVAMLGDGINDAPALAAADIGIAMGAVGTDLAIDSAHVALMRDQLDQLPRAIELGQRAVSTIRCNIAFALLTKLAVFALATMGLATLWMAIAADIGTSLLVIAYGLRLLR